MPGPTKLEAGQAGEREPPAAAAHAEGRLPDFFIVGHAKSGTTALYEMLRRHPQIFMPDFKEPWFFATDMRPRFQPPRAGPLPQTLEEYMALFAGARADQRAGEASASYLWSRTAAQRIAEVQPAARIIAILREPASFLRSLHMQFLQSHVEAKRDLRTALELEGSRREGKNIPRTSHRPQLLLYSDHVRYVEQLRRYRELFPASQVLVLIYDDFRNDNEASIRSVLRLLEVREELPIEVMNVNETRRTMRSQRLDDLVHAVSVGRGPLSRAFKGTIKALTPERVRREVLRVTQRRIVYGTPPPPDEQLMIELRRRYKPEVVALSEYLRRDLVRLWGYDDLG
jgi:hypothetical protein